MIRNETVVEQWVKGRAAKAGNLWTDGMHLYSYRLMIGTASGGIIYNHTAGGGSFYSQATSAHVGLATRTVPSAKVIKPDLVQAWDNPCR